MGDDHGLLSSVGLEMSYVLNDVDGRSPAGSAGRAFKIHWENRSRMEGLLLPGTVVVTVSLSHIPASRRKGSSRGVGGFSNVELPDDDLALEMTGSSAWASRWINSCL